MSSFRINRTRPFKELADVYMVQLHLKKQGNGT